MRARLAALVILGLCLALPAPAQDQPHVFRNATLYPISAEPIDGGTMVVQNGTIRAVGPTGAVDVPALITAHRAHDIQAALRLQEEFGVDLILDGAAEAYLLVDEIAEAGVPVVLHPTMARPSGTTQNAAFTTAATLHEAGIPVAIQSGFEPYVPKTRIVLYEAAIAVANGLPRRAALASITRSPAQMLGLDAVDTIAPGQAADLALFDGDPFEYTTHVCTVLSGGQVVGDECK